MSLMSHAEAGVSVLIHRTFHSLLVEGWLRQITEKVQLLESTYSTFNIVHSSTPVVYKQGHVCGHKLWFPLTLPQGEMKLAMQTSPASANSRATSAMRLMFSSRSPGLKPRFLFSPWRMLSPSRVQQGMPWHTRYSSRAMLTVVLPAPDRPNGREQTTNT